MKNERHFFSERMILLYEIPTLTYLYIMMPESKSR